MLIFQESEESNICKIRKKFWKEFYEKEFGEVTAEKVMEELENESINYEKHLEPFYVYFERLEKLDKDGLRNLSLPFLFRTRDISGEQYKKIKTFIDTLLENNRLKNKAGVIKICKKE